MTAASLPPNLVENTVARRLLHQREQQLAVMRAQLLWPKSLSKRLVEALKRLARSQFPICTQLLVHALEVLQQEWVQFEVV